MATKLLGIAGALRNNKLNKNQSCIKFIQFKKAQTIWLQIKVPLYLPTFSGESERNFELWSEVRSLSFFGALYNSASVPTEQNELPPAIVDIFMQFVGQTEILLLFQVTKLFWFHYAAISNKPRSNLQRSKKQGSVVNIMPSFQQMYVGSLKLPRP